MTAPRHTFLQLLGHEIHVTEWGDPSAPLLVLSHGLARTGRDFDELAQGLSDRFFVICPDQIGRGLSSWSPNPVKDYRIAHYADIALEMVEHYNAEMFSWIGTSMGGLIGMWLASEKAKDRMSWLMLNDVAPEVPQEALDRIITYVGHAPQFETIHDMELWFRDIYTSFGPASDAFWRRMVMCSARRTEGGKYTVHYDTQIVRQFDNGSQELPMWGRYDAITCPVRLFWGAKSDLLLPNLVRNMQTSGPKPKVTRFEECGHAPTLSRVSDIETVRAAIRMLTASDDGNVRSRAAPAG